MKAPALFIGHGSPMNALADQTRYAQSLRLLRARFPEPKAVLCVSAHWMTRGTTAVTHMDRPRTIHDFYGFPDELFAVQYPAPGHPALAEQVARLTGAVLDDQEWGLDHGTWSVLRHVFPAAGVPVVQLSLDMNLLSREHFKLGEKLKPLRDEGVWILGSGNVVHNLRQIRWEENAEPFPWAAEFDLWFKERLRAGDFRALIDDFRAEPAGPPSVPTLEHYLPVLYVLGAAKPGDRLETVHDEIQNGSISMLSFSFSDG